jgi:hypothetical protein
MNDELVKTGNGKTLAMSNTRTLLAMDNEQEVKNTVRKLMKLTPGGQRLTIEQATDLAVYALLNGLNPFNSEAYYLPKVGPIAGVAGYRRKANEYLLARYGNAARFWCEFEPADPGEADFDSNRGDIAYKCTLHDSETKRLWEGQMIHNITALKKAGMDSKEAVELAREIAGPEPVWTAVGKVDYREQFEGEPNQYRPKGTPDKWDRHERAKKRAEKWAIRKAYPSCELPDSDLHPVVIEGMVRDLEYEQLEAEVTPARPAQEILRELGYHDGSDPTTPQYIEDEYSQTDPVADLTPLKQNSAASSKVERVLGQSWPASIVQAVVAAGSANHPSNAVAMLNFSDLPKTCSPEAAVAWSKVYRGHRDAGDKPEVAAQKANAGSGQPRLI